MASLQHLPDPKRTDEPAESWASNTLSALGGEGQKITTTTTTTTREPLVPSSTAVPSNALQPSVTDELPTAKLGYNNPYAQSTTTQPITTSTQPITSTTAPHQEHTLDVQTPGLAIPGAFPAPHPSAVAADLEKAKESAQAILISAGETVKSYLPESVRGYLPGSPESNTQHISPITGQTRTATLPTPAPNTATTVPAEAPVHTNESRVPGYNASPLSTGNQPNTLSSTHPAPLTANQPGTHSTSSTTQPSTAQKLGEGAAIGAGALAGSTVSGLSRAGNAAYESAPSTSQVANAASTAGEKAKSAVGTAAGITYEYVPSTEQIKNAGSKVVGAVESVGSAAAGYVPEGIKSYLPESIVGPIHPDTHPQETQETTLPSSELGQNTSPHSHTGVGTLPGPPGEKDVARLPLPDDTRSIDSASVYSTDTQHQSAASPLSTLASNTLPLNPGEHTSSLHSKDLGHNNSSLPSNDLNANKKPGASTHTPIPLPGGDKVASVPPPRTTHDIATSGGVAELGGSGVALLPAEKEFGLNKREKDVQGGKRDGFPSYMGGVQNGNRLGGSGAMIDDASTRSLHGSLVDRAAVDGGADKKHTGAGVRLENSAAGATRSGPGYPGKSTSFTTAGTTTSAAGTTAGAPLGGVTTASHGPDATRKDFTSSGSSSTHPTSSSAPGPAPGVKDALKQEKDALAKEKDAKEAKGKDKEEHVRDYDHTAERNALGDKSWKTSIAKVGATAGAGGLTGPGPATSENDRAAGAGAPMTSGAAGHSTTTGAASSATGAAHTSPSTSTSTSKPPATHHTSATTSPANSNTTSTSARRASMDNHGTAKKEKHGFMDKLKGEFKILGGKLGNDEEKVEAGRRMMGKN